MTMARSRIILVSVFVFYLANPAITSSENEDTDDASSSSNLKMEARLDEDESLTEKAKNATQSANLVPGKSPEDSYLQALEYSQNVKDYKLGSTRLNRREFKGPVYRSGQDNSGLNYGVPAHVSFNKDLESLPVQSSADFDKQVPYGSHQVNNDNYGPPFSFSSPSYGPPANSYGPPAPAYVVPHSLNIFPSIDLSWPFALKLNAFTVAKILLKLVLFKMIVKFIGIICLLLFVPKLEIKKDEDDGDENDDERSLRFPTLNLQRLNNLTVTVLNSIEKFENLDNSSGKMEEPCPTIWCFAKKALFPETWQSYTRLFNIYLSEERER